MSSKARQKGYRTVKSIREALEANKYIVANVEKNSKFAKERDLFGLWDLLAIKGQEHLFIQAKTNLSVNGQKKGTLATWLLPYLKFGHEHGSSVVKYQVWVKYDGGELKVVTCE